MEVVHCYDVISIIGVFIIIVTYFLLQWGRLESNSYSYSWLNIVGSVLILYSLFYDWNLSAVIIEISWIIISFLGIFRNFQSREE
jgi:hypothetical protein